MNIVNEYCPHPEIEWVSEKINNDGELVEVGFCMNCNEEIERLIVGDEVPY